jgi:hypothetical protein
MLDVATKLYSMWREILTLGRIETDSMLFASASCITLQLHVAPSSKPPIRCPCFVFNVLAVSRIHYSVLKSASWWPWFLSWLCIHMHMLCSRTRVWTFEPNPQEKQAGKTLKMDLTERTNHMHKTQASSKFHSIYHWHCIFVPQLDLHSLQI